MGKAMFSPDVVGTDAFLDLPDAAQLLYFRLGFEGTYGKIVGVRRIARGYGNSASALQSLYDAGYLFDHDGACWVRDYWRNNTFKKPNHNYAATMPEIVSGEIRFVGEPFKSAFLCPDVDKPSISFAQASTETDAVSDTGAYPDAGASSSPDSLSSSPEDAGEGAHGEGEGSTPVCPKCGEPLRPMDRSYYVCDSCRSPIHRQLLGERQRDETTGGER